MQSWAYAAPASVLRQVADLFGQVAPFDVRFQADGKGFEASTKGKAGLLALAGQVSDDRVLVIRCAVLRHRGRVRVDAAGFFEHLCKLGPRVRLLSPETDASTGAQTLWVELRVQAEPMSMVRSSAFVDEVRRLQNLACTMQAALPVAVSFVDLEVKYKDVQDVLALVRPMDVALVTDADAAWAEETLDFLRAGLSVALSAGHEIEGDFALGVLAHVAQASGQSFGRFLPPGLNPRMLGELAQKAPGRVVAPAARISSGTHIYELGNEAHAMLGQLVTQRTPAVFTGGYDQLQSVFHGGQGGANDPLLPVVRHAPSPDLDRLVRFAVADTAERTGGLSASDQDEVVASVRDVLDAQPKCDRLHLVSALVSREVDVRVSGYGSRPLSAFMSSMGQATETLAGVRQGTRLIRSLHVQERYTALFTDPGFLGTLQAKILGQDAALAHLVRRLKTECLTRPLHQPIRYCAQGVPGTGKSWSASLIAEMQHIPYINIDAASMPDYYTASAQLLGSGRGIVGSHQAGRLEQAAKHHLGAVVEVSDLDHAAPQVRAALADLFLQVLELGEIQSATGAMVSCRNLIFAFTLNLPQGQDEAAYRGVGFGGAPSEDEVKFRVVSGIKDLFSTAFVSRVGEPILFRPMTGSVMAEVVERTIGAAIEAAAERLGKPVGAVHVTKGVGQRVVAASGIRPGAFGARGLMEQARGQAAQAFLDVVAAADVSGQTLVVEYVDGLVVRPV